MSNLAVQRHAPLVRIASQAELSWNRLPEAEQEAMRHIVGRSLARAPRPIIVHAENRKLAIQYTPSGYVVVYRPGQDVNTVVSVFTPREAGELLGAPAAEPK